ncbi:MAG: chemotaxis protein CheW [Deltaproteobacteria bacterium]|nr:chemotaxis protein CheW [Deltaproteobacteria bacterium]
MIDGEAPAASIEPAFDAAPLAAAPRHLALEIGGQARTVPVAQVHEVMRVAAITRVPHAPAHVRGLTTLRGRLVPVLDVGASAGGGGPVDGKARIVVLAIGARLLGVLVDRVGGVIAAPVDDRALDVDGLARWA